MYFWCKSWICIRNHQWHCKSNTFGKGSRFYILVAFKKHLKTRLSTLVKMTDFFFHSTHLFLIAWYDHQLCIIKLTGRVADTPVCHWGRCEITTVAKPFPRTARCCLCLTTQHDMPSVKIILYITRYQVKRQNTTEHEANFPILHLYPVGHLSELAKNLLNTETMESYTIFGWTLKEMY